MGGWPVGYLRSVEELNMGTANTSLSSEREEDLSLGRPHHKSSALTHQATLPSR